MSMPSRFFSFFFCRRFVLKNRVFFSSSSFLLLDSFLSLFLFLFSRPKPRPESAPLPRVQLRPRPELLDVPQHLVDVSVAVTVVRRRGTRGRTFLSFFIFFFFIFFFFLLPLGQQRRGQHRHAAAVPVSAVHEDLPPPASCFSSSSRSSSSFSFFCFSPRLRDPAHAALDLLRRGAVRVPGGDREVPRNRRRRRRL